MLCQRCLDLPKLNTMTLDFDLEVPSAKELYVSIGPVTP